MSACIGKGMEFLTVRRLSAAAFKYGAISRTQMGGIQDNSATDALVYSMNNALKILLKFTS
jgi:hypothetical protein